MIKGITQEQKVPTLKSEPLSYSKLSGNLPTTFSLAQEQFSKLKSVFCLNKLDWKEELWDTQWIEF